MVLTGIEETSDASPSAPREPSVGMSLLKQKAALARQKGSDLLDRVPGGRVAVSFILGEPADAGAQTVRFRKPAKMARRVHTMRLLLIAAALFAIVSAATSIPMASELSDNAEESRGSLDAPFYAAAAEYSAAQASGDEDASLAAAEWLVFVTEWRDGAIVFDNVAYLLLILLSAFVVWIPIRYILLLRAMPTGHPRVWWQLRGLARLQITVELVKVFVLLWATSDTVYVEANLAFAPVFIIAPAILWMLRGADVQAFFSHHRFEAADAMPVPAVDVQGAPVPA